MRSRVSFLKGGATAKECQSTTSDAENITAGNLRPWSEPFNTIAAGRASWQGILQSFWQPFHKKVEEASQFGTREVINELNAALGPHLFPAEVQASK